MQGERRLSMAVEKRLAGTSPVHHFLLRQRTGVVLAINFLVTVFSYLAALFLRFDLNAYSYLRVEQIAFPLSSLLLLRTIAYLHWGVNKSHWRYASVTDLSSIMKAHLASTICFAAAIGVTRFPGYPRSLFVLEFLVSILLSGGLRLAVRMCSEKYAFLSRPSRSPVRKVIVLGAGDSGHLLVKYLQSNPRICYEPVAVLDDSERFWGASVHGVPIRGSISLLHSLINEIPNVSAVIVAIPTLSRLRRKEIETLCNSRNIAVKRLQSFEDIACTNGSSPIQDINVEALLEKESFLEHEQELRLTLAGKKILVTGAGGSIGSELVRQLMRFEPPKMICIDNCEYNVYNAHREFTQNNIHTEKRFIVANITDKRRISKIIEEERPDIVFHAAAYKHLPLMEENCYEAFVNNIIGTKVLLESCIEFGVGRFVFISTDKAVSPTSVMGCSKRICEWLVWNYSRLSNHNLHTAVVRFGNVINSSGSVIPLFKEQIMSGGPITITDPEVERFFMSIREAVRLVLTAGILGNAGEVYVFDMGKPVKILDIAQKMLALYDRPDVPIQFTGLRPGEKLTETLIATGEKTTTTRFKKIKRLLPSYVAAETLQWVATVETQLDSLSDAAIGNLMKDYVGSRVAQFQAVEHLHLPLEFADETQAVSAL